MSVWVGISPLIGAGSFEGFAVGATVSGAFFLAITAPRRLRRRRAAAAGGARGVPVRASSAEAGPAAYRSRHRLGDPSPGRAARGGTSAARTRRSGAFLPRALPSWASRDDAQPDTPVPDVAFPDGTVRSPRRPEVRRLPRHAAPAAGFGTRVSGRVTGLFAARPLAGGVPS